MAGSILCSTSTYATLYYERFLTNKPRLKPIKNLFMLLTRLFSFTRNLEHAVHSYEEVLTLVNVDDIRRFAIGNLL